MASTRKLNWLVFLSVQNFIILLCLSANVTQPIGFHYLPAVHDKVYSQPGDINIGALIRVLSDLDSSSVICSDNINGVALTAEMSEAVAWTVDLVNRDPDLLPNVTLGFITRGVCSSANQALATSLSFLPRSQNVCNGSDCEIRPMTSSDSAWLNHDVIGVVSPGYSIQARLISALYAVAEIPLMGIGASSDEFSNKALHPYYFRLIPPDRYMVKAILKFIAQNGWSHISILYNEGTYGQNSYENTLRLASDFGICMASSHVLNAHTNYSKVVADLLLFPRARVVILYTGTRQFRKLIKGVFNNNAMGHFIFVGGDALNNYDGYDFVGSATDPGLGVFVFDFYTTYTQAFYDHVRTRDFGNSKNPWIAATYEYLFNCSFEDRTCNEGGNIFQTKRYRTNKTPALIIDAILTFAQAAHDLFEDRCPGATGKKARDCFTGSLYHQYIKQTKFKGLSGFVSFDENQDVKGKYYFGQLVYDHLNYSYTKTMPWKQITRKNIGVYDTSTESFTFLGEPISWAHINTLERVVPWTNESLPIEIPESVCSRPCVAGEYKIEKEVPCCWDCLRCRDNERLVNNNTGCEACPSLTWPDPLRDYTTCVDIYPTYPKVEDTLPLVVISLAGLFIIVTVAVTICYIIYRNERVIKASSKELSVIQLTAIFLGYLTIVLFQTKPDHYTCSAIFVLFCMSFAILYCPLLVKTIRIFRIFTSGAKNEKPRFISPTSQLTLTLILIFIQVTLCTVTVALFEPTSRRSQPIWSEKLVELSCDLTFPGLASFLGYNMVLVFLCSVFAFMVRKLPDNFNESKFISMCVSTTLLIWLAFVPTYFTAGREYIRTFLLCMALLLNHSVALVLLFMPKIYAAIFVPSDTGNFSNKRS